MVDGSTGSSVSVDAVMQHHSELTRLGVSDRPGAVTEPVASSVSIAVIQCAVGQSGSVTARL